MTKRHENCGEVHLPNARVFYEVNPDVNRSYYAEFLCSEGYFLKGQARLSCEPPGGWEGLLPECKGNFFCTL